MADRNEDHQDLIRRSFRRQVDRFTGPDSPFAGSPDAPPWVGPLAPDPLVLEGGDDGQMVVSFLTHTLRVTKGDDEAS